MQKDLYLPEGEKQSFFPQPDRRSESGGLGESFPQRVRAEPVKGFIMDNTSLAVGFILGFLTSTGFMAIDEIRMYFRNKRKDKENAATHE